MRWVSSPREEDVAQCRTAYSRTISHDRHLYENTDRAGISVQLRPDSQTGTGHLVKRERGEGERAREGTQTSGQAVDNWVCCGQCEAIKAHLDNYQYTGTGSAVWPSITRERSDNPYWSSSVAAIVAVHCGVIDKSCYVYAVLISCQVADGVSFYTTRQTRTLNQCRFNVGPAS